MKKLLSIFAVFAFAVTAFVGLSATTANAVTGKAAADTKNCKVTAIGDYPSIDKSNSAFTTVGANVQVKFKVEGNSDCRKTVTLVAWNAPNGTDGKPYSAQTVHDKKTATYKPGTYTMTVKKPLCYYQIDFVRGSSHLGQTGGPYNYNYKDIDLMIAYVHGGKKCAPPVEKKVPVCNPATGQIITVKESDASKYTPVGSEKCKSFPVCDFASKSIKTIKGYQFESSKMSKDLNAPQCKPAEPNKVPVCNPATGQIIEVDEKDESKYKPVGDEACADLDVCILATGKTGTIKGYQFDSSKHSKDLNDAACTEVPETPVTPEVKGEETPQVIASTGPAEALSALFGTGALAGTTTAYIRSRRALNK